jgi:hypothetical protein
MVRRLVLAELARGKRQGPAYVYFN